MPSRSNRLIAACLVGTLAFWAYTQTLLPGVDAGDTGGFQAAVLWPEVSARQAYPLYYNLAYPLVRAASHASPARGLNLFSAIWGAAAAGLLTAFCATVTGSLEAGIVAGLLLAFSYTFWTQAIIAEVYTLHLALLALCLLALQAYSARPTTRRLALFFAVFAVSFGNHLSMILLLVPFAAFLIARSPRRGDLFRLPTIVMAVAFACAGALQYWPNLMSVWNAPDAPATLGGTMAAFWFDVTKADWRETMVLGVQTSQAANHLGMWWFDLRQQFGIVGLLLAGAGAIVMLRRHRAWGLLLLGIWAISTTFALTYNVGDSHVFFLPAHVIAACFAGAAVSWPAARIGTRRLRLAAVALVLAYAGWRAWDTWPAVDRHRDRRGEDLMTRLTLGLDSRNALLVTQLDWQIENVLLYYGRYVRPDVAWLRLPDVFPRLPFLVEDTHAAARDVVLTGDAARDVVAAFGPAFPLVEDATVPALSLVEEVGRIPRGAPYVFCLLPPPRDQRLGPEALASALDQLTGGHPPALGDGPYRVMAGLAGEAPSFVRSAATPFRQDFRLLDEPFTIRMESWLGTDTFRRAGFAQVLRGREHVLIVERGVSLVWFGRDGSASPPVYAAGLYAVQPRYRIPAAAPRLAGTRSVSDRYPDRGQNRIRIGG